MRNPAGIAVEKGRRSNAVGEEVLKGLQGTAMQISDEGGGMSLAHEPEDFIGDVIRTHTFNRRTKIQLVALVVWWLPSNTAINILLGFKF